MKKVQSTHDVHAWARAHSGLLRDMRWQIKGDLRECVVADCPMCAALKELLEQVELVRTMPRTGDGCKT